MLSAVCLSATCVPYVVFHSASLFDSVSCDCCRMFKRPRDLSLSQRYATWADLLSKATAAPKKKSPVLATASTVLVQKGAMTVAERTRTQNLARSMGNNSSISNNLRVQVLLLQRPTLAEALWRSTRQSGTS